MAEDWFAQNAPDWFDLNAPKQSVPAPSQKPSTFENIVDKANEPLLPEYGGPDTSYHIPGMGMYSPEIPNLGTFYNRAIRPLSSPLVLASMGLEAIPALIAGRGARPPIQALQEPIPQAEPLAPKMLNAPAPTPRVEVLPPRRLNAAPQRLTLPAAGESSASAPRFFGGKHGVGDVAQRYPYDEMIDYAKSLRPQDVGTYAAGEPGNVTNIGGELAANMPTTTAQTKFAPGTQADLAPRGALGTDVSPVIPGANLPNYPQSTLEQPAGGRVVNPPEIEQPYSPNKYDVINRQASPYQKAKPVEQPYNPNRFDVINRRMSSVEQVGEALENDPQIRNGDKQKPSPTILTNTPTRATAPEDLTVPKAGAARPTRDISALESNLSSSHRVLLEHPETVGVAEPILRAYDNKIGWIQSSLQLMQEDVRGLGKRDRVLLGKLLDSGEITPENQHLADRAESIRMTLDAIHSKFPEGVGEAGKNVGYIENYFTHIMKDPELHPSVKGIINYYFGKDSGVRALFEKKAMPTQEGTGIGDMYEKALGTPDSPYVKERSGQLTDLEWDVNRVLPAYVESAAKVIFDKPAVEAAKAALKAVPDGTKLKDLATWYIKNYTRYDSEAELHNAWIKFASQAANITARSFIDFNPGLHMLHLGEIPANILPELGPKYTAVGIKNVAMNPVKSFTNISKMGLLQGDMKPYAFKTPAEKWQSAAYFFNGVERFVKAVAYEGARQKFIDGGMRKVDASLQALRAAKDLTLTVDPARQMKGLSPESNIMGGEIGSKLGGQFKGIPAKIAEQYYIIGKNALRDKKKAATMMAGAGLAIGATGVGAHMFHLNPSSLAATSAFGAFGTAMKEISHELYSGNWEKALLDTAAWVTPGGQTAKKMIEYATTPAK